MGFMPWFNPPENVFFDMLERQASIVTEAAHQLVTLTKNFTNLKEKRHEIENLEHRGDQITHDIHERLNRKFRPPIDQKGISRLTSALDEVLDYIDGTVERMFYYGLTSSDAHMIELAKTIHLSAVEIEAAVKAIRSIKDPRFIEDRCIEVNRLENLADDELSLAMIELFATNDSVRIIKLKDIYEHLEMATDYCEDLADVLSDIAIRHSQSKY
jgi:uncharacterized protein Yka (UPF0111/DUF47 family)